MTAIPSRSIPGRTLSLLVDDAEIARRLAQHRPLRKAVTSPAQALRRAGGRVATGATLRKDFDTGRNNRHGHQGTVRHHARAHHAPHARQEGDGGLLRRLIA